MEGKHANGDAWSDSSLHLGGVINSEAITVFLDLLDFHNHISSARCRVGDFGAGRTIRAILSLDVSVELIHQGALAFRKGGGIESILLLQFSSHITSEVGIHGHRAELQYCCVVHNVFVSDSGECAGNPFLKTCIVTFRAEPARLIDDRLEAVLVHRASFRLPYLAIRLKQVDDDSAARVGVRFKEGKKVEVYVLIEGQEVFRVAVELCGRILEDLRAEFDGLKDAKFIRMELLKLWAKFTEKHLAVVYRVGDDQVQVGVDKDGPWQSVQLKLFNLSGVKGCLGGCNSPYRGQGFGQSNRTTACIRGYT